MVVIDFAGNVKTIKETEKAVKALINGTCLQGEVECSYSDLVRIFGKPNSEGDGYKVEKEWLVLTPDGPASIYAYKGSKSYQDSNPDIKEITNWQIGGHNPEVCKYILGALKGV